MRSDDDGEEDEEEGEEEEGEREEEKMEEGAGEARGPGKLLRLMACPTSARFGAESPGGVAQVDVSDLVHSLPKLLSPSVRDRDYHLNE